MNRRAVLKALPAAVAVAAAPVAAHGIGVERSRIIELFRRHQTLTDEANEFFLSSTELDGDDSDEIMDRLFYDEIFRISDEIMATPCQTPADFAAKVIVATCRGGIIPDWDEGDLFIEARALVAP